MAYSFINYVQANGAFISLVLGTRWQRPAQGFDSPLGSGLRTQCYLRNLLLAITESMQARAVGRGSIITNILCCWF